MLDSESPVFCFDFLYLLDPTVGHHIEDMVQKVYNRQFLRYLDLYYVLICLKSLSHGLALLEHEPTVCSTVHVHPEGSPRYLTVFTGVSLLPSSLNLIP